MNADSASVHRQQLGMALYNKFQERVHPLCRLAHTRTLIYLFVCTLTHMHKRTYTHTHTHTHMYVKTYIRKQIQAIEGDTSLDETERTRRKQVSLHSIVASTGSAQV